MLGKTCNCSKKTICPLGGQCLVEGVVYGATVKANGKSETYTCLSEPPFKSRFNGHNGNIRNRDSDGTRLSAHIWKLKYRYTLYSLDWHVTDTSTAFNQTTGQCRLCLKEKWYIMFRPEGATLNLRSEFYSHCRHKKKHLLGT